MAGNHLHANNLGIHSWDSDALVHANVSIDNRTAGIMISKYDSTFPGPTLNHNLTNVIQTQPANQSWNGWLNLNASGLPVGPLRTYQISETSTVESRVQTRKHGFCGLTKIQLQTKDAGTNRWCKLVRNDDGTWTLSVRGGANSEARCECTCF